MRRAVFVLCVASCVGGREPIPRDGGTTDAFADMAGPTNCEQQLGDTFVTFCETFDAPAGTGNRAGGLDGNVWVVSRGSADSNLGQNAYNEWYPTALLKCDNTTPQVKPPDDVIVCNGQLREALNDNGGVVSLSMSPMQPFDFAGRTGTVSFDVSNDGDSHGAWPELWIADAPVPDAFSWQGGWESLSTNGLAVRFDSIADAGDQGECPNGNNMNAARFTVGSSAAVHGGVLDDTRGIGPGNIAVQIHDCVIESSGPPQTNHIELRIAANQIEVYATDAGIVASKSTLRLIATITGIGLTFTRGYVYIEDAHNDGAMVVAPRASQQQHTFAWDNVAFDGPFVERDFAFDAPDGNAPGPNGSVNLGQPGTASQPSSWIVPGLPANAAPGGALVTFNLSTGGDSDPTMLDITVNGHDHPTPWPFTNNQLSPCALAVTIPASDLIAGANTVQLGADQAEVFYNVDLILTHVPGGVAVLPGNSRTYP